ncbi:hypothetical protein ZYGR_0E00970 [Zygosaccharomyces rouxii]|uniref:ZYRO0B02156p n=2 Tax=Zygosaccharomyces rouxii TaxID=4956 RepID=C5DQQ4_ZYGRC|nr:uncharacterized protein ZYRO0B02156g [Zygosaccharomyces rouxii]KAH9200335.1 hypothetical protein LQ764DRAFT_114691 [Zygosaccharomyces rouxii]GAV47083.1 hypothetical protein ZYGR_0E00970 [Zygosaccharomyces rouxii]CAR26115.1 ZYRO0B02156p [Zygosaccharomyces rouxii]
MQNSRRPGSSGRGPGRPPKRGRKGGKMSGVSRPVPRPTTSSNQNGNNSNNNSFDSGDTKSRSVSTPATPLPDAAPALSRQLRNSTSYTQVDYNLKKRKIIPSEDFAVRSRRHKSNGNGILLQENDRNLELDPISNPDDDAKELIERDANGKIVNINEPNSIRDAINGATGLPLNQGPPEKVKKEYMWSYKKNSFVDVQDNQDEGFPQLTSRDSEFNIEQSDMRNKLEPCDVHADERDVLIKGKNNDKKITDYHHGHIKIKATVSEESKSKLFGQNSVANLPGNGAHGELAGSTTQEIENDDFCSACLQSGSFLCCDTCPKSFHFLCLNPPVDPDELPDGDWSCPQCVFKMRCPNGSQAKKYEKDFLQEQVPRNCKLFGKLLFQLEITNPRQFSLPQSLKDTFQNVKSGPHGVYNDGREKEPLSEKQLFGAPYGQSLTMLDCYNPDIHVDQDTGKFLTCYKCRTTKMGTWDSPEDSRLIMRCDYCKTPWHLDCIPHAPRASLKNLGTKWKCPLHAPEVTKGNEMRRLSKFQKFIEPTQTCGFKNNGEVDIVLDEITSPGSKAMIEAYKKKGDFPPVALLSERSVKLDFMDKVFRAKKVQRDRDLKYEEHLIDKLLTSSSQSKGDKPLEDLLSFIYFQVGNNPYLKKLWDFKGLCKVAQDELARESISRQELNDLLMIRKLLESKPKEEIMNFFNLKE